VKSWAFCIVQELLTLKSLAYNRSTLARASLFEKIAALWLDDATELTGQSQDAMDQILADLVSDVESAVRARVAEGLAARPTVPKQLIEILASDPDIQVSGPVLSQCAMVAEKILLRVARDGGAVHRQAIAKRAGVPVTLSEALCERREAAVMKTLLANPGAQLSRKIYREALRLAQTDEGLRDGLLARGDMPKDFAYRMFWWVSAALRGQILERFAIEPAMLDAVLRDVLSEADEERLAMLTQNRTAKKSSGGFNTVIHALNGAGLRAFVQELAAEAGVAPETAARLVNDQGGESLGVVARALGADTHQVPAMIRLLDKARGVKVEAMTNARIENAQIAFDAATRGAAQSAIAVWNLQLRTAA
jgi:uncharacterized protein (DUF2336 family)